MIYAVALVFAVIAIIWVLRPAYLRWRDYLQHAPDVRDAPFGTKVLLLFKGLRTKMLARSLDGLGVALPAINAIGEWIQPGGGIDLTGVLPSIPLPWAAAGSVLSPAQYSPLVFLGLGRLTDYLRNHTTTAPGTIDAGLAVKVAGESNNVDGATPTPSLAAIVDPSAVLSIVPATPTAPGWVKNLNLVVPAAPARRARKPRAAVKRRAVKRAKHAKKNAKKRAAR